MICESSTSTVPAALVFTFMLHHSFFFDAPAPVIFAFTLRTKFYSARDLNSGKRPTSKYSPLFDSIMPAFVFSACLKHGFLKSSNAIGSAAARRIFQSRRTEFFRASRLNSFEPPCRVFKNRVAEFAKSALRNSLEPSDRIQPNRKYDFIRDGSSNFSKSAD